jgi:hypothetical protein
VPKYDPSKTFSIAARAAAKLRAAEAEAPHEGVVTVSIPTTTILTESIPKVSIPTVTIPNMSILTMTTPAESAPVQEPADRFVKAANWLWDTMPGMLTPTEWIVYAHLYRLTIGFHRPDCVVGYGGLADRTRLSKATVIRTIARLRELNLLTTGDTTQAGTQIVLLAPAGVVTMSILKESIPTMTTPGVSTVSIPTVTTPEEPQLSEGVVTQSILTMSTIKDKGTSTKDNNRQDVVAVLQAAGYNVDPVKVAAWIARGVTPEKVQGYIDYIRKQRGKIANPVGWLITAVEAGWSVEADQVAAARDMAEQVDTEEQMREMERQRVAALMAELGPERIEALRQEEREKCKHDPGYHNQPNERMRGHYIEALLRMRLLAGT